MSVDDLPPDHRPLTKLQRAAFTWTVTLDIIVCLGEAALGLFICKSVIDWVFWPSSQAGLDAADLLTDWRVYVAIVFFVIPLPLVAADAIKKLKRLGKR